MSKQQQAINDYLQALLLGVDDEPLAVEEAQPEQQTKVVGLEELVAEIPDTIVETTTEIVIETKLDQSVETEALVEVVTEVAAEESAPVIEKEELIPEWAQQAFQCLLFNVSGLTLAVPLVKLNSVMPWSESLVATPNQTDWYLGLVNQHGTNVKVIDTALMVLPENRHADLSAKLEDRFSHVLLVNDSTWGLACDSIGDVIWLDSEQVKWRNNKTKRPWLAGTAREHLCAIMDTEVFADMMDKKTAS